MMISELVNRAASTLWNRIVNDKDISSIVKDRIKHVLKRSHERKQSEEDGIHALRSLLANSPMLDSFNTYLLFVSSIKSGEITDNLLLERYLEPQCLL